MKAMVLKKYGSPDYFELCDVEKPAPRDNEVLVRIHSASINSWDWEILMGKPFVNRLMCGLLKPEKIKILGCDIAGCVETVGKNVSQFQTGDEVFGDLSASGWGGFAEFVCAPENALALKPANLTFDQAAAVPQAGLLALQGLNKGRIQSGQKVLINGAGGGSGTFAIQIAKLIGAEVTGVDSKDKLDTMRSLGADHVIDYEQENFTKQGKLYDLILDVQAHHSIFDCKRTLSPEGVYVFVGGTNAQASQAIFLGPLISLIGNKKMVVLLHKANKDLDSLKELLSTSNVAPCIDKCYPLNEVPEAFRYFGEGHVKGKAVITVIS